MNRIVSYIRSKIEEFLSQFVLPTEAELRNDFPHRQGCQCDRLLDAENGQGISNLEQRVVNDYVSVSDHWLSFSTPTQRHLLRCRHCGACAEYSPVPTNT